MNPIVSIIVPIYNMEYYLNRCFDSLLAQSLTEIEIIAVNDGSTDSSLELIQEYAWTDSRITIINKQNGGVSAARNDGISVARGKYIGFVDPDDWIDTSMYEKLYQTAVQEEADIVMCNYIREFETHSKVKKINFPDKYILRGSELKKNLLRRLVGPLEEDLANPENLDVWGTVWSKLYRADLLINNHLEYMDLSVIGSNEDTLFNIHAFYYADSFVFLNHPLYHYWRANTASITSTYNPKLVEKFDRLYSAIQSFITEKKLDNEYEIALNNRICMNVLGLGLNIMSEEKPASFRKKLKSLHNLLHNDRIRQLLKTFDISYCPLIWRVFFLCAKFRISLAIYLLLTAIDWLRKKNMRGLKVAASSHPASGNHYESRRFRNHADELLPPNRSKQNSV